MSEPSENAKKVAEYLFVNGINKNSVAIAIQASVDSVTVHKDKENSKLHSENLTLQQRVNELTDALWEFGFHKGCLYPNGNCNCGLMKVLETKEGK